MPYSGSGSATVGLGNPLPWLNLDQRENLGPFEVDDATNLGNRGLAVPNEDVVSGTEWWGTFAELDGATWLQGQSKTGGGTYGTVTWGATTDGDDLHLLHAINTTLAGVPRWQFHLRRHRAVARGGTDLTIAGPLFSATFASARAIGQPMVGLARRSDGSWAWITVTHDQTDTVNRWYRVRLWLLASDLTTLTEYDVWNGSTTWTPTTSRAHDQHAAGLYVEPATDRLHIVWAEPDTGIIYHRTLDAAGSWGSFSTSGIAAGRTGTLNALVGQGTFLPIGGVTHFALPYSTTTTSLTIGFIPSDGTSTAFASTETINLPAEAAPSGSGIGTSLVGTYALGVAGGRLHAIANARGSPTEDGRRRKLYGAQRAPGGTWQGLAVWKSTSGTAGATSPYLGVGARWLPAAGAIGVTWSVNDTAFGSTIVTYFDYFDLYPTRHRSMGGAQVI